MDQDQRARQDRRLARRELWAGLWLARILGMLGVFADAPISRAWRDWFDHALDLLTRCVAGIVVIRAANALGPCTGRKGKSQFSRAKHDPRRHGVWVNRRAILGGRLRKAFKAKGVAARIAAIRAVLKSIQAHAAKLARRLRKGMTRRFYAFTRVAPSHSLPPSPRLRRDTPLAAGAAELRALDTS